MRLLLLLAGFIVVLLWGWSKLGSHGGRGTEKALYTALIVASAYIVLARMRSWPFLTPVRIFRTAFVPLGRWLEWLLGTG